MAYPLITEEWCFPADARLFAVIVHENNPDKAFPWINGNLCRRMEIHRLALVTLGNLITRGERQCVDCTWQLQPFLKEKQRKDSGERGALARVSVRSGAYVRRLKRCAPKVRRKWDRFVPKLAELVVTPKIYAGFSGILK